MEVLVVALFIWNLFATAYLVGVFFRLRDITYQLAILRTQLLANLTNPGKDNDNG